MKTINKVQHTKEHIDTVHAMYYPQIAKEIRKDLKVAFGKDFKFSVKTQTYSGGGSIRVTILEGTIDFYTKEYQELERISAETGTCEARENLMREYPNRYTPEGKIVMEEAERIHRQYNHDKSDSQSDYFDVNYYGSVEIWKYSDQYVKRS